MDPNIIAYQIIRSEYFNYIMANSINMDYLIHPSPNVINFIKCVEKHSNSEEQVYAKIISNVLLTGKTDNINTFAKCDTAFDKLIYIFSVTKSLGEYVKNSDTDIVNDHSIVKIIKELTTMLDEHNFQQKLFKDPKYIKFMHKHNNISTNVIKIGTCTTILTGVVFFTYTLLKRY